MDELRKEPLEQETTVEQTAAPATAAAEAEQPKAASEKGRKVWIALGIAAAVLVMAYGALCGVAAANDKVLDGTYLLGVDMGGKTRDEVEQYWDGRSKSLLANTRVQLTLEGEVLGAVSLESLGVKASAESVVQAAWEAGHSGNILVDGWYLLRSFFADTFVLPRWDIDADQLRSKTTQLGKELASTVVDGSWRFDEKKTDGFYVTKEADGQQIDAAVLVEDLRTMLQGDRITPVACVYTTVAAEPVDLEALHRELCGEMAESIYDKTTGGVTQSRIGVQFDLEQARAALEAARPGEEFVVAAQVSFPKVDTEELEQVLFRDVIGSYTTYVSGTWQRIENVRRAASLVNNYIMNPGETISYNEVLGPQTAENGYYLAPSYIGGKTVDDYGGGVCQISSTLYYATLLANLEIVTRYCHQFAPGYIPFGTDATVYAGPIDFVFRNNTDYPIKIVTYWDGYYVTVDILGTKVDDTYVEVYSEIQSVTAYKTIYKETDTLAPGQMKEEQSPYTGYYVLTWRNVYAGDGTLLYSQMEDDSDYEVRDQIILVGKEPEKAPETPEQEPTPDPVEPTPDPTPAPGGEGEGAAA